MLLLWPLIREGLISLCESVNLKGTVGPLYSTVPQLRFSQLWMENIWEETVRLLLTCSVSLGV